MRINLIILFLGISVFSFAQISRGKVSYDVEISSDNPQMLAAFGESSSLLEIFFVEGKSRSNLFMGEMSSNSTISKAGEDSVLVLLDNAYMGKIAMMVPRESEEEDEMQEKMKVTNVQLIEGETKKIIGYTCKKAIVTYGGEYESEIWYTEEISPTYRADQYLIEEISGLPLEMSSKYFNMELKMKAYEFKEKISKKQEETVFSTAIPKGYTVKTMEDLKNFGKGK